MNTATRREHILDLREKGLKLREIASVFSITRQRVHQIINNKSVNEERNCLTCGKPFTASYHRNTKYCSPCSEHLLSFSGRNRTREIVRMRDKHTCQKCGKVWNDEMRRFDIHHLNRMCGKKSRGYDSNIDLTQLTTLCHKCHMNEDEVKTKISNKSSPRPDKPITR